jgi:putative endonuclease
MGERKFFVYIMTNLQNTTLYTGVTNDLPRRVQEHKRGEGGKFSKRYNLKKLVYIEVCEDIHAAIAREKQIKGGSRMKKLVLIEEMNPEWRDLTIEYFL